MSPEGRHSDFYLYHNLGEKIILWTMDLSCEEIFKMKGNNKKQRITTANNMMVMTRDNATLRREFFIIFQPPCNFSIAKIYRLSIKKYQISKKLFLQNISKNSLFYILYML